MGSSQEKTSLLFMETVIIFVFSLSDQEEPRDTEDFPHQHLIMLGELVRYWSHSPNKHLLDLFQAEIDPKWNYFNGDCIREEPR